MVTREIEGRTPAIKKPRSPKVSRAEFRQELKSWIDRQSLDQLDFEALEMAVRRSAPQLGRRRKRLQTAPGETELERAWYDRGHCDSGFAPRDCWSQAESS